MTKLYERALPCWLSWLLAATPQAYAGDGLDWATAMSQWSADNLDAMVSGEDPQKIQRVVLNALSDDGVMAGTLGFSFGEFQARIPTSNIVSANARFEPPTLSAGCDGIDINLGSFTVAGNIDFTVKAMKKIGAQAASYFFQLALDAIMPQARKIMSDIQRQIETFGQFNMDSCQLAKGVVTTSLNASSVLLDKLKNDTAQATGRNLHDTVVDQASTEETTLADLATVQSSTTPEAVMIQERKYWNSGNTLTKALAGHLDNNLNPALLDGWLVGLGPDVPVHTRELTLEKLINVIGTVTVVAEQQDPAARPDNTLGFRTVIYNNTISLEQLTLGYSLNEKYRCVAFDWNTSDWTLRNICNELSVYTLADGTEAELRVAGYNELLVNYFNGYGSELCARKKISADSCIDQDKGLVDLLHANGNLGNSKKELDQWRMLSFLDRTTSRLIATLAIHQPDQAEYLMAQYAETISLYLAYQEITLYLDVIERALASMPYDSVQLVQAFRDNILISARPELESQYQNLAQKLPSRVVFHEALVAAVEALNLPEFAYSSRE